MSSSPTFTHESTPAATVEGAGRWLADQVGQGFAWVNRRRELCGHRGDLTMRIRLQPSSRNRAGESTIVDIVVGIDSAQLRQWRELHPHLAQRDDARMFASMLINLTGRGTVGSYGRLREHASGIMSIGDVPDVLRDAVVGVLPGLENPERAVHELPDQWWAEVNDLIEWAVSHGHNGAAQQMLMKHLHRSPGSIPAFRKGLVGAHPTARPSVWNPEEALGRSAAALHLLTADDEIPIRQPRRRRTLMQLLRGER